MHAEPRITLWTPAWRAIIFTLSAASIFCLLFEMYHLCPMRAFALWVLLPATLALIVLALLDRAVGDCRLWRAVLIGTAGGLLAAVAYDLFRLPFVFSQALGWQSVIPPMPLYKVFPAFGAMLLGEPADQPTYSLAAHLLGWAYHFSNGATFGVMYLAIVGDASRRHWGWAVLLATGIEAGLLLSPYTGFFGIGLSGLFVAVTLTAHIIFGITLGRTARRLSLRPAAALG